MIYLEILFLNFSFNNLIIIKQNNNKILLKQIFLAKKKIEKLFFIRTNININNNK